jgi:hypothetical protein
MRYFYFAISEYAARRIPLKGYVSHQHDMEFIMDSTVSQARFIFNPYAILTNRFYSRRISVGADL